MASYNKCSLDNLLQAVLSISGSEQNMLYPPYVFSNHFNIVTSYLIDEVSKIFPTNNQIVDIIEPYLKTKLIPVINGYVTFPEDYRNFLKASISVHADYSGECGGKRPIDAVAKNSFELSVVKAQCETIDCNLVNQAQWGNLTTSTYKKPSYDDPIVCLFGGGKLKICPFDIKHVEISYIRQEKVYLYGYKTLPDDTYIFDKDTSVESEWTSAAYKPFFEGLSLLYSAYSANSDLTNFNSIIKQMSLV